MIKEKNIQFSKILFTNIFYIYYYFTTIYLHNHIYVIILCYIVTYGVYIYRVIPFYVMQLNKLNNLFFFS